ncbi:MAG: RagB/SusD family nutrient uptake outer membrane protein [Bacteroidales bacterium]|nr:RagB/SusD family nutrient uptake outer membrane protein [Bacteroidales bacterium]
MKNLTYILFILMIIFLGGCSEDFLDTNPQGEWLEENYFINDEQVELGLNAAYAHLRIQFLSDESVGSGDYCSQMLLSNLRSDGSNVGGQRLGDGASMEEIGHFTLTTTNLPVYYRWFACYSGINRCNLVINNPDYESDLLPVLQAEAKYLRAYFYFQLVQFYGDVPLILTSLSQDEYGQARRSVEDVFNQIITDLETAVDILPEKSERVANEINRATKGAAKTLLGKVYLTMASPYYNLGTEYYSEAAVILQEVIQSEEYDLEEDYDMIWNRNYEHGTESIFEIDYSAVSQVEGWWNGIHASGSIDIQFQGPRLDAGGGDTLSAGWGFNLPSQDLQDAYAGAGDSLRAHGTLLTEEFINSVGGSVTDYPPTFAGAYDKKHTTWSYMFTGNRWRWETNERIYRFADVLLMAAEALNRKNGPDDATAREYVNRVRARAMLDPVTESGDALFEIIKLERRLELAMEGHRFFDLVRWGIAAETINQWRINDGIGDIVREFKENRDELFPIPYYDIVNSGFTLIQNQGY